MITDFVGDYDFLSNDYESKITYKGREFLTVDAAFKSINSLLVKPEIWKTRQIVVMRSLVFRKFLQNPSLATRLVATDTVPLINGGTWQDSFWGYDDIYEKGENHLGIILMKIREFMLWMNV